MKLCNYNDVTEYVTVDHAQPRGYARPIRQLKSSGVSDISLGGPTLAAHAIKEGLVDEYHLLVVPVVVGGGVAAFPKDFHLKLELLDERRFRSGVVHLHYRSP